MELTQEYLKECLDYNPDTGSFTWKERPADHFKDLKGFRIHKARFANKEAGTIGSQGYSHIFINKKSYRLQRLAWLYCYGYMPLLFVDHINGIRSDNRLSNLREVSNTENIKNGKKRKNNTSGVQGVSWHQKAGKWMAQIMVDRKSVYLGLHETLSAAISARKEAEIKYNFHKNHGRTM